MGQAEEQHCEISEVDRSRLYDESINVVVREDDRDQPPFCVIRQKKTGAIRSGSFAFLRIILNYGIETAHFVHFRVNAGQLRPQNLEISTISEREAEIFDLSDFF